MSAFRMNFDMGVEQQLATFVTNPLAFALRTATIDRYDTIVPSTNL
jgi:hypothetical protein